MFACKVFLLARGTGLMSCEKELGTKAQSGNLLKTGLISPFVLKV